MAPPLIPLRRFVPQTRLMNVLEPGGRGRTRPRSGTFTSHSQRGSRSVSGGRRGRREEVVSHHPTGRSRSSDSLSLRAESVGGNTADYRAHSFFRERSVYGDGLGQHCGGSSVVIAPGGNTAVRAQLEWLQGQHCGGSSIGMVPEAAL